MTTLAKPSIQGVASDPPTSTGSNPASSISCATVAFALGSSPHRTSDAAELGGVSCMNVANTVLNAFT